RFAKNASIQRLLAERLADAREAQVVLRAMAGSALKPVPPAWVEALTRALSSPDAALLREAMTTVRSLPLDRASAGKMVELLVAIAGDDRAAAELRLLALAAVPGGPGELKPALFKLVCDSLDREQPVQRRALAVDVAQRARLSREHLLELCDS